MCYDSVLERKTFSKEKKQLMFAYSATVEYLLVPLKMQTIRSISFSTFLTSKRQYFFTSSAVFVAAINVSMIRLEEW